MNYKSFMNLFTLIPLNKVNKPLGRWNIHNYSQTTLKIKYANEDNCGVCSNHYRNFQENNQEIDNLYIYMIGAESLPDNIWN